jgi:hypothetical protein
MLAASISLAAWTSIVCGFAAAHRYADRVGPAVRYLADASLWIYVVHFPLVGLVQVALYRVDVPPSVKFALSGGLALIVGALTFELARRLVAGTRPRMVPAWPAVAPAP